MPRPDVLVYNTNQCRDVQDWFGLVRQGTRRPCHRHHLAPKNVNDVTDAHIDDVARQIEALVPTLEAISGNRLDMDRLRETVALSRECTELWKKVLETAMATPAPLTFFDGTIHMGPAVVPAGHPRGARLLPACCWPNCASESPTAWAAVEGETVRIYWEGMPVWGRLRQHSELFAAAERQRAGLHLLQQLDLPGLRRQRSVPQHGARPTWNSSSSAPTSTRSST